MSESSNLPPIFVTSTSISFDDQDDEVFDPTLLQTLKMDLLSTFDSLSPKVEQLEKTFSRSLSNLQSNKNKVNFNADYQLDSIKTQLKNMHNISIELSRKVQALSLKLQTSSALAAPKLLRPINESFCDFKEEFDMSLKNLAKLSNNITEKSHNLKSTFKRFQSIPKDIDNLNDQIINLADKCLKNENRINEIQENSLKLISQMENSVCFDITNNINEAEELLSKMNEATLKGYSQADSFLQKVQTTKESIQNSFKNLTSEIEHATSIRIQKLNLDIENATKKGNQVIDDIQKELSEQFDLILKYDNTEPEDTVYDQIEQAREESEIIELINRLDQLQEKLQNLESSTSNDEEEVEIYTKEIDGKTVKFICNPQTGTFTME